MGLSLNDSTSGASTSAGSAADAGVGINLIDVAFGNSSDGALVDAGTASNADVSDFVSHFFYCFWINNVLQKYNFFSDIETFFQCKDVEMMLSI